MTRSEMYRRLRAHTGAWDMIVVGGGATGRGRRRRRGQPRLRSPAAGAERFRQRHVQPQHQARPRRRALPRTGQPLAGDGSPQGARTAPAERAAPGPQSRLRGARTTIGGKPPSTASDSSSTISSPASTASAPRASSRATRPCSACPPSRPKDCRGGVIYFDGQFDDARLLINLVTTGCEQGATLLNYAAGHRPDQRRRRLRRWRAASAISKPAKSTRRRAKVVINATGPFADNLRRAADPGVEPMIAP